MAGKSGNISLWINVNLAGMAPEAGYGAIEDGALAVSGSRISGSGRVKISLVISKKLLRGYMTEKEHG